MVERQLLDIYQRLSDCYGPQQWWPGDTAFEIMLGAVLTQNTAWTNVEKALENLKRERLLSPQAILRLPQQDLAARIKPSGYFNIKARRVQNLCGFLMKHRGARALKSLTTPELRAELLSVNGIGPETADDILLYAFQRPVFVIDAYTRRIFSRLGLITGNEGYETVQTGFENALEKDERLFNEYHALIVRHAKGICNGQPLCDQCCLSQRCSYLRLETLARISHQGAR